MVSFEEQLDWILDRLRSGEATLEERAALESQLKEDPELRKHYRARMRMEAQLLQTFRQTESEMPPPVSMQPANAQVLWRLRLGMIVTSLAACLALGALIYMQWAITIQPADQKKQGTIFAMIRSQSAAVWHESGAYGSGAELTQGELLLKEGLAEIEFTSGAIVTLEGPASFEIKNQMLGHLKNGKASIEASGPANGFTVTTPHGELVDLGTRFSVLVGGDNTEVEVLEGKVSVNKSGKVLNLSENEASLLTNQDMRRVTELPSRHVQPRESSLIYLESKGMETSVVYSNQRERMLDPTMLMVKLQTRGSSANRRALFSFLLDEIDLTRIKTVALHLNQVPSSLGFASHLPEEVDLGIYGVMDGELDHKSSVKELRWEKTPGYMAHDGSMVHPEQAVLLTRVRIKRGQQSSQLIIDDQALLDFIQKDTNGRVSFLITRETRGHDNFSLVHAFASSMHPEKRGPLLVVTPE